MEDLRTSAVASVQRTTALALWLLLAGIYLLTSGGHTYSIDEELIVGSSEGLVQTGRLTLSPATPDDPLGGSLHSPGHSLLAAPLIWLAYQPAPWLSETAQVWLVRALAGWVNPLVTAGSAALLYLAAAWLGYRQSAAIGTALIYGLATMAWGHSKTSFAEPLTGFCLLASVVLLVRVVTLPASTPHRTHLLLLFGCGGMAGSAVLVKIHAGLHLPLIGSAVLVLAWQAWRTARTTTGGILALRLPVQMSLAWGGGALLALGVLMAIQWWTLGSPFSSAYGSGGGVLASIMTTPLHKGLYGLIVSPGKGILWYAPPVLLLPFAVPSFWRRTPLIAGLCVAMAVAHFLFYAHVKYWHGDGAWGPRYLNMILPLLILPLAAWLATLRGWHTPLHTGALIGVLLLAVPVQVGGVAINFQTYVMESPGNDARYYQIRHSPIVAHLQMVRERVQQQIYSHYSSHSVSLLDGFSYSEGNRATGEQFPRWTLAQATLAVRPTSDDHPILSMHLNGCRPADVAAAQVQLAHHGRTLLQTTPCPARHYAVLLPAGGSTLYLTSSTWNPRQHGFKRSEVALGVRIEALRATAGTTPLTVQGALIPVPPLPPDARAVGIRNWVVDYRYLHWDFWWWYLLHSGFAPPFVATLLLLWGGIALTCILTGGALLWRVHRQHRQKGASNARSDHRGSVEPEPAT